MLTWSGNLLMPFNSFPFILVFLPAVMLVLRILRRRTWPRAAGLWLLAASLLYYGYADPTQLPFLAGSVLFNWYAGHLLLTRGDGPARSLLFKSALTVNIAFLCGFKYVPFLFETVGAVTGHIATPPHWPIPPGISFFTITQIMYLVDTYQGLNKAASLSEYAAFASLFPYVMVGPLVRSRAIIPQFERYSINEPRLDRACRGLYLFSIGLAKKVVLADSISKLADTGFTSSQPMSMAEAWFFALTYSLQLYFDFSGYSDMAVGCAWMIGIDIPQNFEGPFRAVSISEFWQRWHISLSGFITSYLYTPMLRTMGKATLAKSAAATIIAMSIAGLWHGANWTYVAYGLLHGFALALNQIWRRRKLRMPDWLGWILTFGFVNIAFCVFRSPNLPFALQFLHSMLPHAGHAGETTTLKTADLTPIAPQLAVSILAAFFFPTSAQLSAAFRPTRRLALVTAGLLMVSFAFMDVSGAKQFIYRGF